MFVHSSTLASWLPVFPFKIMNMFLIDSFFSSAAHPVISLPLSLPSSGPADSRTKFSICGWNLISIRRVDLLAKCWASTHTHTHAGTYPLKSAQLSSQVGFLHIRRQPTCNFFSLTPPTQKKSPNLSMFQLYYYFPLHFLTFNKPKLKEHFFGCWWNETLIHRRKTYGVWYCGKDL